MVELKDTNSLNHFSLFFFFSHHLPPQIFCILHTVGKDICFPFLPSLSAHLHQGAWGAVVHHCQLLLAVSAGQAESCCTPHCLWLRKPLCHQLLEPWEGILKKCHRFELFYFFFLSSSVTAGWNKIRSPVGWAAVPALFFTTLQETLGLLDIAQSNEQRDRPPRPSTYPGLCIHEKHAFCLSPETITVEGLIKGQQQPQQHSCPAEKGLWHREMDYKTLGQAEEQSCKALTPCLMHVWKHLDHRAFFVRGKRWIWASVFP